MIVPGWDHSINQPTKVWSGSVTQDSVHVLYYMHPATSVQINSTYLKLEFSGAHTPHAIAPVNSSVGYLASCAK